MGGAVGRAAAKRLGIEAVKQVGKEVAVESAKGGTKATITTMLTNPVGYEYVGGNALKRSIAFGSEVATDGALSGGIDNGFRTAIDGGSLTEIGVSMGAGAVGGAIMSPVIGGGMKAAGKGAQKVFGKNNYEIDGNGKSVFSVDEGKLSIKSEARNKSITEFLPKISDEKSTHIVKDYLLRADYTDENIKLLIEHVNKTNTHKELVELIQDKDIADILIHPEILATLDLKTAATTLKTAQAEGILGDYSSTFLRCISRENIIEALHITDPIKKEKFIKLANSDVFSQYGSNQLHALLDKNFDTSLLPQIDEALGWHTRLPMTKILNGTDEEISAVFSKDVLAKIKERELFEDIYELGGTRESLSDIYKLALLSDENYDKLASIIKSETYNRKDKAKTYMNMLARCSSGQAPNLKIDNKTFNMLLELENHHFHQGKTVDWLIETRGNLDNFNYLKAKVEENPELYFGGTHLNEMSNTSDPNYTILLSNILDRESLVNMFSTDWEKIGRHLWSNTRNYSAGLWSLTAAAAKIDNLDGRAYKYIPLFNNKPTDIKKIAIEQNIDIEKIEAPLLKELTKLGKPEEIAIIGSEDIMKKIKERNLLFSATTWDIPEKERARVLISLASMSDDNYKTITEFLKMHSYLKTSNIIKSLDTCTQISDKGVTFDDKTFGLIYSNSNNITGDEHIAACKVIAAAMSEKTYQKYMSECSTNYNLPNVLQTCTTKTENGFEFDAELFDALIALPNIKNLRLNETTIKAAKSLLKDKEIKPETIEKVLDVINENNLEYAQEIFGKYKEFELPQETLHVLIANKDNITPEALKELTQKIGKDNLLQIIDSIKSPEHLKITSKIFSDERIYGNSSVMEAIEKIISKTDAVWKYDTKINLIDYLLKKPELLDNEFIKNNLGDIISSINMDIQLELLRKIFSNEKFLANPELLKPLHAMVSNATSIKQTELINKIITNEKILNNKELLERLPDIISARSEFQINLTSKILDDEKLLENKEVIENLSDIIRNANTKERANVAERALFDEKINTNDRVMSELSALLGSISDKSGEEVALIALSKENLFRDSDFIYSFSNLLSKTEKDNLPVIKAALDVEGLDLEKFTARLDDFRINNGAAHGIDTSRVKKITSILQHPEHSKFFVKHLNNGADMDTIVFLLKTQQKINADKPKVTGTQQPSTAKLGLSDAQQDAFEIFKAKGLNDKETSAIMKAISDSGEVDLELQTVALRLLDAGVAKNKIGEIINLAKITDEFNPKIIDDFIALQNMGLNPHLEKYLAVLNNISTDDAAIKLNANIKKQLKGMMAALPDAKKAELSEKLNIDWAKIEARLNSKLVKAADGVPRKAKVVSGLRPKSKITGMERLVIDKFNPDEKIWRSEAATKQWAEELLASMKGRDYNSVSYPDANPHRERILKEWFDFMETDETVKENPFIKIMLTDFITADLAPETAALPPQFDKNLVKEILNEAIEQNKSFNALYSKKLSAVAKGSTSFTEVEVDGIKGRWYTVPQTDSSKPEYRTNVEKVRTFSDGTNWCIRTYNAEPYVTQGNMHFFVDENGLTQICVRENAPGSVYEIQKRQQNATVPIAYIDVIQDFMSQKGLSAQADCQGRINNALAAKPKFDELRSTFRTLTSSLAETTDPTKRAEILKSIFEKMNIDFEIKPDGTYKISHYSPDFGEFTLSDLGVKEDILLANVSEIEGKATFKNSNATALPMLKRVGGRFTFDESQISDVRRMTEINGYRIEWD